MNAAFPTDALELVRCPRDAGPLEPDADAKRTGSIRRSSVHCAACHREYPVVNGILRLLEIEQLDEESHHEMRRRDLEAPVYDDLIERDPVWTAMERAPALRAAEPVQGETVLELGCGTGRFTVALARAARFVLAVDFSATSLEVLASRLEDPSKVGLVHADATRLAVVPRRFGRVFSTLASNLPSWAHRVAMYQVASEALGEGGVFVFLAHNHEHRLRHLACEGRYAESGIYRRLFTPRDLRREVGEFFAKASVRPIVVVPPLAARLGLPLPAVSRIAERIAGLHRYGKFLLVSARVPRPPPGARRG